jgi:PBSX family phage portal protein
MSRSKRATRLSRVEAADARAGSITSTSSGQQLEAFTFGDPEEVLNRRDLLGMMECLRAGRWYEPPIAQDGLARAFQASPHHSSAILLKRNLVKSAFIPHPLLSHRTFEKLVQDYLVFGHCYPEKVLNRLGLPMRIEAPLAKYVRRGLDDGQWFFVPGYKLETEFAADSVMQIAQPDINQELYGVPEYIAALQSALLNESATLFRRRYYLNGSHAGYILYSTGNFAEGDVDKMRAALKASKGPGNFRNMFVHAPDGKAEGIKLVPIAEAGAKDEFLGIKNTTRDDVLAAHRVPPQLLGIVPANAGGFGKVGDAVDGFWELEIQPLQDVFLEINDWVGLPVVNYRERQRLAVPTPANND